MTWGEDGFIFPPLSMGRKPKGIVTQQQEVSSVLSMNLQGVSSGWGMLDIILSHFGGFPEGSINLISGSPNSGKTSICIHATVDAIKRLGWRVMYFDVESRLLTNPQRLLRRGLTEAEIKEKLLYYPAENIVEKVAKIIRGEITASENYPKLIIIDSLSSFQSLKQFGILQAGKWEEQTNQLVAALSRSIVESFKDIFSYYVPAKKIVMLITSQVRANLQNPQIKTTKPALGYYMLHAVHTHVSLASRETQKTEVDEGLLGIPLEAKYPGMEARVAFRTVEATLEKGQLSPLGSKVKIKGLMFQVPLPESDICIGDFHNLYDILRYGRNPATQFLKRSGEKYITPNGLEFSPADVIESPSLREAVFNECFPYLREKFLTAVFNYLRYMRKKTVPVVENTEESEEGDEYVEVGGE